MMLILSWLLGSFPSAILACRYFGLPDPRIFGSGNPGATNVLRVSKKAASLTLAGDILKGLLPILIGKLLYLPLLILSLMALCAFLGHVLPVYSPLHGGKGVATAFGSLIMLSVPLGICLAITWLVVAYCSRYSSLAAIVTGCIAPIFAYYILGTTPALIVLIMGIILVIRHRKNIKNLYLGVEDKFK